MPIPSLSQHCGSSLTFQLIEVGRKGWGNFLKEYSETKREKATRVHSLKFENEMINTFPNMSEALVYLVIIGT